MLDSPAIDGDEKPPGIWRWLTTVDHKDIGVLYIVFAAFTGIWGAVDAMMIRTALLTPAADIWHEMTYNGLFTSHGLTMLFLFATPLAIGLANYFVPLLVDADDMAFPRVNAVAFWLLPPAAVLIRTGIITDLLGLTTWAPPMVGWTLYVPLSIEKSNFTVNIVLLGLHLSGVATTLGGINVVATVVAERSPDVSWADLDIFTWTMFTTGGLILFAFPLLGAVLLMLLGDRLLGTMFFTGPGGPVLFQHLFWFFGHPEVYILVLPAMGLISHILPRFTGRTLFGYKAVVYSTFAIAVLSFGVWAHHMFTTGLDPRLQASFMVITFAIAVPSAVKTFNWIATIWNGRIRVTAPFLFCFGAIANFIVGGITGVFLGAIPVDRIVHGTNFVVGHFHLMLVGMMVFSFFAACYYWFPLLTGRWYNVPLAKLHFWLSFVGVVAAFGAMLVLGIDGLPRRMASYPVSFAPLQQLITVAAYVLGIGQLVWLWNVLRSLVVGDRVESGDPWDLADDGLLTREWAWFDDRFDR
ncbi:cbb3-type cytochrome c oxidase subunit I [Halocalculus aciditolerans]|uniref:Cytochrome-c oxidase n=1 Tax=Halocalculus aciditolerans TaxID=1383812 RepID=A0A830FKM8_9EURY|nr:cbb3-type cytochrome c oxidase subunit I [Halocalculus aciditolerans]GGL61681.1 cytochrome-c oxidase [Halocalculus aciditolerans]